MMTRQILDFFSRPGPITSPGAYDRALEQLPDDLESLVRIVQGLVIHEFVAESFYGTTISADRRQESHIRPARRMIERIFTLDDRPLTVRRPPERRLVGVCRHFMVLLLAMLRAKRIPARGRCGFGAYFNPGYFEDHVVCEYWNASEGRWVLADPQFDDVWRERLGIRHNVLDVPRDQFLVASEAWARCRRGDAEPNKFGIVQGNQRGSWFLAANLIHDAALLNKVEMLRWDAWGAIPRPNQPLPLDDVALFDQLASLTREPDESFESLRALYEQDERVKVPGAVFNSLLNRTEAVAA
jgi:Transglutaminase-like superfamily